MTTIIADTLDAYAKQQDRVFTTDRRETIGASEIGQCLRKMFWLKHEHQPDKSAARDKDYTETWGARLRGTMFEQHFWVPAMRARFGSRLLYAGEQQRTLVNGFLSATPDGLLTQLTRAERMVAQTGARSLVIECKTLDPRADSTAAKPAHVFQTHVQMGLFRSTTAHRPECAVISYTDTSFWSETREFVVKYDPIVMDAAYDRARRIMTARRATELEPEGWISGGSECKFCPFTKACGVERSKLPYADVLIDDPVFIKEIREAALAYRRATQDRDIFDAQARAIMDAIKNRLREKGVRRIPGVLAWSSVKGRTSYDMKEIIEALHRHGIDEHEFEITGEPSDRLIVSIGSNGSAR